MNQMTWQGKLRQLRGEFKREWGKFTHNDRQRLEGEVDRILGQMQQKYGYTREHAWKELEQYWQGYGKRTQSAIHATLKSRKKSKSWVQRVPWVTLGVGIVALIVIVAQLRWPEHLAKSDPAKSSNAEKKRQESIRQEKERDVVDEQSWESFPASDPPASW